MSFRNTVVAAVVLWLTACTTLRPIEDFSPSKIAGTVEPGDEVHIVTVEGKVYELTITSVDAESLTGRASSGKRYKVMFEAIRSIDAEEVDAVKTVGGTLATAWVVLSAIVVYAFVVFFESIDDE